jgi:hypothetical protein
MNNFFSNFMYPFEFLNGIKFLSVHFPIIFSVIFQIIIFLGKADKFLSNNFIIFFPGVPNNLIDS